MVLNIVLWVIQVILAAMFGYAGYLKGTRPIPELVKMFPWPGQVPVPLTRFIGVVEVLGAIGVILPELTGILPWLTPLAALGFFAIQVLAIGFHAMRGETQKTISFNLILLVLSGVVVWGRWYLFA